jgi:hypothetical protein
MGSNLGKRFLPSAGAGSPENRRVPFKTSR